MVEPPSARGFLRRAIASVVVSALIVTAPGNSFYQVLAQEWIGDVAPASDTRIEGQIGDGRQQGPSNVPLPLGLRSELPVQLPIAERPVLTYPAGGRAISGPMGRILFRSSRVVKKDLEHDGKALPGSSITVPLISPLQALDDSLHRSVALDRDLLERSESAVLLATEKNNPSLESAKHAADRAMDFVLQAHEIEPRQFLFPAVEGAPENDKGTPALEASHEDVPLAHRSVDWKQVLPTQSPASRYSGRPLDLRRYPLGVGIASRPGGSFRFQITNLHRPIGYVQEVERAGGFWNKVRVIPEKSRNRGYYKFLFADAIFNFLEGFQAMFLPGLSSSYPSGHFGGTRQGLSEGLYTGGEAVSSMVSGKIIDQSSIKKILVRNPLGIALAFAGISAILWTGHFAMLWVFALFLLIEFGRGFLTNRVNTGGEVAFNRFFSDGYEPYLTKGEAIYQGITKIFYMLGIQAALFIMIMVGLVAGSATPFLGSFIHGANSGFGIAFLICGVLALVMTGIYSQNKFPKDNVLEARDALTEKLKADVELGPRVKGIFTGMEEIEISRGRKVQQPVLIVEMSGNISEVPRSEDSEAPSTVPSHLQIKGGDGRMKIMPVRIIKPRSMLENLKDGAQRTWSDSFLRMMMVLSVLVSFLLGAAGTVNAAYASKVLLHAGISMPHILSHIPFLGSFLHMFVGVMSSPIKDAFNFGAYGLYLLAAALGSTCSAGIIALWPNKRVMEFDSVLSRFHSALSGVEFPKEFPKEDVLEAVVDSVDHADDLVLKSYRDAGDPGFKETPEGFHYKLVEQAKKNINEEVFDGHMPPEEMTRLAQETGLEADLKKWSERHFDGLMKDVRKEIATGLNSSERSVRRSVFFCGLGVLALLGTYHWTSLWTSLAWAFASSSLLGPGLVILQGSFTNQWISEKYPNSLGRIYNFRALCVLAADALGAVLFGFLTDHMAVAAWVGIFSAIVGVIALQFFKTAVKDFPLHKSSSYLDNKTSVSILNLTN